MPHQVATTTRYYVAPRTGTGVSGDAYRPRGFCDGNGLSWIASVLTCQDYGGEPTYFVTAQVTDVEHAKAAKIPGVVVVQPGVSTGPLPIGPAPTGLDLDQPLGRAARSLARHLEAHGFPALWIRRHTTLRELLRALQRYIQLAQRMQRFGRLFPPGVTLETWLFQVAPAHRQLMIAAAVAGGGTGDVLCGSVYTMRDAIMLLADQLSYPRALLDVAL